MTRNLTYALKDGKITHISEVERGLHCGCNCPACGENLIARKGQHVTHHFAHQSTKNCEYAYESSLHFVAKEILSRAQRMMLPPVYLYFPDSYKERILVHREKEIIFDRVELEQRFNTVVPDIVVHTDGKRLFIEIFVTHRVDQEKLNQLEAADHSTIEIDLSKIERAITSEELTSLLLENNKLKYWKYNSFANKYRRKFYQAADKQRMISKNDDLYIDGCPIRVRTWYGRPYADFMTDCLNCQYCISHSFEDGMLCSGRQRISFIQDFNLPIALRMKQNAKYDLSQIFGCPGCGDQLILRRGRHGSFLGCSNYPYCKFTASKDVCPNCGGRLVRRTGEYGDFLGCSNYPHCKLTVSMR